MPEGTALAAIRPTDLPAPPQAALEILQACASPDVNTRALAEIASRDPVLTAELLRMANSAFFGVSREVTTVARAVMILGHRALRNLVLCISMQKAVRTDHITGFDVSAYWEDSLRRAVAAKQLGETQRMAPDECLTMGLLQDFGLLVLLHLNASRGDRWPALRQADPDARRAMERELFGTTHGDIGALLAETWSLPDELGVPLAMHHQAPPPGTRPIVAALCRIARCADWMAAVYTADDKPAALARCQAVLAEELQIDQAGATALLARMSDGVEEAGAALGLRVRKQIPFDEVMRRANKQLADETLSYQELTWRLERALAERDRLAAELQRELDLAREIQQSLLPHLTPAALPIHAVNVAARAVSGDFYDFFPVRDGRILFNLADVSGKGMNAALLMAKTSSLFHCLGKDVHDPARLMELLNAELCESSVRGMFVTMVAGLLHPATGRIDLVNAGHPPALWVQASGEIVELAAAAPPLGVLPEATYQAASLSLDSGTLFIFSDGLSECRPDGAEALGIEGVKRVLTGLRHAPPERRLEQIVDLVSASDHPPRDDLTLLLIGR
jgi:serine phosphatase RsbU (regulator of sigma subunit)/HD-like signal output (HDOD) protein